MRKSLWIISTALVFATLGMPKVSRADDITYDVDQTIGGGSVVGTIITDGTIGVLAASDIVGGSVTITDSTAANYVAALPASIFQFIGDDLSATAGDLLFNFSGTDNGGIAIGPTGLDFFWNIGTAGFGYGCGPYPGEGTFPECDTTPALSGEVAIGTVAATPEPGTIALLGLGLLGLIVVSRKREALGLPQAS